MFWLCCTGSLVQCSVAQADLIDKSLQYPIDIRRSILCFQCINKDDKYLEDSKFEMGPIKPNPAKVLMRAEVAARIAALSSEEKKRQSQIVFEKMINHPYYKSSKRVALFMSTEDEINTMPLIEHVKKRGASAFVPQYAGGRMKMLKLEDGDEGTMPLTRHGIQQHTKDQVREDALDEGLDLVVSPGVAFTRAGGRLGHGGGYYDKFIAHLRSNPETAPKILAVAFNCQMYEEIPIDDHDQMIDGVITAE